jgi:hypothetical protein
MITLTTDQWLEEFEPIQNPRSKDTGYWGAFFDSANGDDNNFIHEHASKFTVWTVVDDEGTYTRIVSGEHWADRLGYFLTDATPTDYTEVTR